MRNTQMNHIILISRTKGEEEFLKGIYIVKNLETGDQKEFDSIDKFKNSIYQLKVNSKCYFIYIGALYCSLILMSIYCFQILE